MHFLLLWTRRKSELEALELQTCLPSLPCLFPPFLLPSLPPFLPLPCPPSKYLRHLPPGLAVCSLGEYVSINTKKQSAPCRPASPLVLPLPVSRRRASDPFWPFTCHGSTSLCFSFHTLMRTRAIQTCPCNQDPISASIPPRFSLLACLALFLFIFILTSKEKVLSVLSSYSSVCVTAAVLDSVLTTPCSTAGPATYLPSYFQLGPVHTIRTILLSAIRAVFLKCGSGGLLSWFQPYGGYVALNASRSKHQTELDVVYTLSF